MCLCLREVYYWLLVCWRHTRACHTRMTVCASGRRCACLCTRLYIKHTVIHCARRCGTTSRLHPRRLYLSTCCLYCSQDRGFVSILIEFCAFALLYQPCPGDNIDSRDKLQVCRGAFVEFCAFALLYQPCPGDNIDPVAEHVGA